MKKEIENPQAFPCKYQPYENNRGMTLRDYFAAKALDGVTHHYYGSEGEEVIAKHAYKIADAMLKERLITKNDGK